MYLASPRTSFSWTPFRNPLRVGYVLTDAFTGFFCSFTDRAVVYGPLYGFSIRIWNTVYSFVWFDHCAERCLCPYRRLFSGFEPVCCPTHCPDDRAL
jgi:hypothetical protein